MLQDYLKINQNQHTVSITTAMMTAVTTKKINDKHTHIQR